MLLLLLVVSPENQRYKENHAAEEKNDTADKAKDAVALKALHDEKDGAHQEKEPAWKVEPFFSLDDLAPPEQVMYLMVDYTMSCRTSARLVYYLR